MKTISELLELNQVNMTELCLRTGVSFSSIASMKPHEQAQIMADAIRMLPDRDIRHMLGLKCIRFFLRKLRAARTDFAVIAGTELDADVLLLYGMKVLMSLGYAQWLEEREEYLVSLELLPRMAPFEEGEYGDLSSADDMLEITLGVCELCGCVSTESLIAVMDAEVDRNLTDQQRRNVSEGLVKLAVHRVGSAAVIRVGTSNGENRTFLKHPDFDVPSMGSERYFFRQMPHVTAEDALFRLRTGLVAGNPWYGKLLEAMFPSGGEMERLFSASREMELAQWDEEMESAAVSFLGADAALVMSMLHELTENVAWMLPTNPGSDLYGFIDCLAQEPGRDLKRAAMCVNMLETTLPRWTLMGYSEEEEQDRIRHELLRQRGQAGQRTAFRGLCPCGSGRVYGKCHGRVQ